MELNWLIPLWTSSAKKPKIVIVCKVSKFATHWVSKREKRKNQKALQTKFSFRMQTKNSHLYFQKKSSQEVVLDLVWAPY